jgi:hypothetical protein
MANGWCPLVGREDVSVTPWQAIDGLASRGPLDTSRKAGHLVLFFAALRNSPKKSRCDHPEECPKKSGANPTQYWQYFLNTGPT